MKILIVEDDDDIRRMLKSSLRKEGYLVESQSNGKDGLIQALHDHFDLIILDVMVPEMTGWQILKKLRMKKSTPVLMLTGQDGDDDLIRGLDLGSDDYVTKPFTIEPLKARIRSLLRRARGNPSPRLPIRDGLEFDTNLRRVFKDGENVEMTSKELSLLEIFIQHRDQFLSKEQLANHLFNSVNTSENEWNTIEVYIYNLRKKLGKDLIKTRRGIGYELNA